MQTEITAVFSRLNGDICLVVDESTYDQIYEAELTYDDMGERMKKFREHHKAEFTSGAKMFEVDKFTLFNALLPKETADIKGFRMKIEYDLIHKSEIKQIVEDIDIEC